MQESDSTKPPLASNQFIGVVASVAYNDRLKLTEPSDRFNKSFEVIALVLANPISNVDQVYV